MNLIIDGFNIAFRCHHVYDVQQGLTTSEGVPTGIVYGFLKSLLKWKKEYPKRRIIVTWDTPGGAESRQAICPSYKANRTRDFDKVAVDKVATKDEDVPEIDSDGEFIDVFSLQIEFLKNFLRSLDIDQSEAPATEADDIIATLVRGELAGESNIIYTSDRDLLQLVTWKTVLETPSGKFYDPDKVMEEYGVKPEDLVTFRALDGDKSDNLPGLPRFRRKIIAKLVNDNDGKLESIYKADGLEEELTEKEFEKLSSFEEQAFLNQKIMELRDIEKNILTPGSWNEDQIKGMCDILEFDSLRSDLLGSNKIKQGFLRFNNEPLLHPTD